MKRLGIIFGIYIFAALLFVGCASTGDKPSTPPATGGTTIVDIASYPDLEKGDTGEYVKILQKALNILDDGQFGPGTEQAVIRFQTEKGLILKYPGTVGQKTWNALFGTTPPVTTQPEPTPSEPITIPDIGNVPTLAWDDVAARKEWSKYLYGKVSGELWPKFKQMTDGAGLCSKYNSLTEDQKKEAVSEMIVAIIFRESGYKPTSRMYETTMGYYSEGLLQLSYPDAAWAKPCRFDKKKDDALYPSPTDPRRTILDPYINMECGLGIMTDQIVEKKKLLVERGVYWAVIKLNGKYQKIAEIKAQTEKNAPFCK